MGFSPHAARRPGRRRCGCKQTFGVGSHMTSTQMIVVAVLSLAVVALLMVRQSHTN